LLIISGVIMYSLYGNMVTFYPPYTRNHHPSISDGEVGLVIGIMFFGILTGSILSSKLLSKLGRKNILLGGVLIMFIGTAGYGLLT
jgi:MFS family permease